MNSEKKTTLVFIYLNAYRTNNLLIKYHYANNIFRKTV